MGTTSEVVTLAGVTATFGKNEDFKQEEKAVTTIAINKELKMADKEIA